MAKRKQSKKAALPAVREDGGGAVADMIVVVRGVPVVLAADLAEFYGTTTSAVNQYRLRNKERFTSDYAFQLTRQEWDDLKSQDVMSSQTHGGRRHPPWAYTEHGVAMMSMGMKNDDAVRLSKVIIDTFVNFRRGALPQEAVIPGPEAKKYRRSLQRKIFKQMEVLLDTEMPAHPGTTLRDELGTIATSALGSIKSVIDRPSKQGEKISAEVTKILAEAEKLFAETRKIQVETDALAVRNVRERIGLLKDLREMATQLERDDWIDVFQDAFGAAEKRLAASPDDKDAS